ncbi:MAG: FixH family protein [Leptospirales bacterium]
MYLQSLKIIKNSLSKIYVNKLKTVGVALLLLPLLNCAALESSYTATLVSGGTHIVGKSNFDIKIIDETTGEGAENLTVTVTPTMTMDSGMVHTTPVYSVTDSGSGVYSVEAYYLMPSMAGSWQIHVDVDGSNIAKLDTTVSGAGTDKATLKGVTDKFLQMGMVTNRFYFIFENNIDAAGNSALLFVATRNSLTEHPSLYYGLSLTDENSADWTVNSASNATTVKINTQSDGLGAWQSLTHLGGGYYQGTGLTIPPAPIAVEVQVNTEIKTLDGTGGGQAFGFLPY